MKSKTKKIVNILKDEDSSSDESVNEVDSHKSDKDCNSDESVNEVDSHKSDKKPKKVTNYKKTLVEGKDFEKLQRKAKRLGAKSLDYSNRKNNKYVVEYEGKKIHFGSTKYEDYLIHEDKERREKYLARAKKITNKNGDFTHDSPSFPNYWAVKLLWN